MQHVAVGIFLLVMARHCIIEASVKFQKPVSETYTSLFLSPPPFFVSAAIDLLYGGIYCFMCQDYIYDKDMEQIAKEEQRKAWKLQGLVFFKYLPE